MDTYEQMAVDVSLGEIATNPSESPDYPFEGLPIRQILRRISAHVRDNVIWPLSLLT